MPLRRIRAGEIELNLLDEGEGPAVLLVHGFPDDHRVWRKQVPALVAGGYRVLAPDTRGCGMSEMPKAEADYTLNKLVGDLVAMLDGLGVERVRLVGHDWGAVIGWALCIAHPERVERYAALSVGHPAAYARGGVGQKLKGYYILLFQLRGAAERLLRAGNWWLLRRMAPDAEDARNWIANLSRPGRLTAALSYYRANFSLLAEGDVSRPAMPVLGLFSARDRYLTEAQMRASARYAAGPFRYERIDGAGHWLQLDAPERVNQLLLDFLGQAACA